MNLKLGHIEMQDPSGSCRDLHVTWRETTLKSEVEGSNDVVLMASQKTHPCSFKRGAVPEVQPEAATWTKR